MCFKKEVLLVEDGLLNPDVNKGCGQSQVTTIFVRVAIHYTVLGSTSFD